MAHCRNTRYLPNSLWKTAPQIHVQTTKIQSRLTFFSIQIPSKSKQQTPWQNCSCPVQKDISWSPRPENQLWHRFPCESNRCNSNYSYSAKNQALTKGANWYKTPFQDRVWPDWGPGFGDSLSKNRGSSAVQVIYLHQKRANKQKEGVNRIFSSLYLKKIDPCSHANEETETWSFQHIGQYRSFVGLIKCDGKIKLIGLPQVDDISGRKMVFQRILVIFIWKLP